MKLFPSHWNLAIGQTLGAWRQFPRHYAVVTRPQLEKPLLITGAYRSGTSWLGNLLTTESTWHLHEPFNPRAGFLERNFVYRRWNEREPDIDTFTKGLLSGKLVLENGVGLLQTIPVRRLLMPARLGLFRGAPRRVLVKDPLACLLTEYLVRNHNFSALLIIRHPAGFVSSLVKLRWNTAEELKQILRDEKLMSDWLNPYKKVLEHGAKNPGVRAHATLYAAIWRVLHGFLLRNPYISVISYERLCGDVQSETQELFSRFGLGAVSEDRIEDYRQTAAENSDEVSDSPFSLKRDTQKMAAIWRERLDENSIEIVREVWATFQLPYYQSNDDWVF